MTGLTTTPTASLQAQDKGVLNASITATATTITIAAIKKWKNNTLTTGGFDSAAAFCILTDGTGRFEYVSYPIGDKAVDATTFVTTLTNCRRGLDPTSASFTAGTGMTWDAGSTIYVVDYPLVWQNITTLDTTQSISGTKTFTAPILITGATSYVGVPHMTTAQRTSLTPGQSGFVYDTDLSQIYKYEGGAWAAVATGSFSNASNTVAGKVDIATAAEVINKTTNDATSGARNVLPADLCVTSSAGAVNGSVVGLNASSVIDRTIGGLGTATGTTAYTLIANGTTATGATQNLTSAGTSGDVLVSAGASALPAFAAPKFYFVPFTPIVSDSATLTNPTSSTAFDTHTYTIPSGFLTATAWIDFEFTCSVTHGTSGTFILSVGLAGSDVSTTQITFGATSGASGATIRGKIAGTAAAGASVPVRIWTMGAKGIVVGGGAYAASNQATNGAIALAFRGYFGTSDAGNNVIGKMSLSIKGSSVLF